jgi:hypothetical protein
MSELSDAVRVSGRYADAASRVSSLLTCSKPAIVTLGALHEGS